MVLQMKSYDDTTLLGEGYNTRVSSVVEKYLSTWPGRG